MTSTALTIIKAALRNLGVIATGETPQANMADECLYSLNQMLQRWNNEKMMIYHLSTSLYTITPGKASYTLGPTGSGSDWDAGTVRPLLLQKWGAFVRQTISPTLNQDYKLNYIPADRWNNIFLKGQTTNFPSTYNMEFSYPLMVIKLWPVPTIALEFGISSYDQFDTFTLTDNFALPSGYEDCIIWNLSIDLAPQFGVDPSATIVRRATQTKANIQSTNSDMLIMETDYSLVTKQVFNVYAG
jgi:hypothetical protein